MLRQDPGERSRALPIILYQRNRLYRRKVAALNLSE